MGKESGQKAMADFVYVTPDYFATLQMPIVIGRSFTQADGAKTQHVAIVNQTFVHKYFHGDNPVGRHLNKGHGNCRRFSRRSHGARNRCRCTSTGEETMYIPATQTVSSLVSMAHVWFQPSWIVRTAGPVEGLTAQMQRALASAGPNLPFSGFYSMRDLQAKTLHRSGSRWRS